MKLYKPGEPGSSQRLRPGSRVIPWDDTTYLPPPAKEWAPNRLPMARARCGCLLVPWPVVVILGVKSVFCDLHGETKLMTKKQDREYYARTMSKIPSEFGYQTELVNGSDGTGKSAGTT